MSTHHNRALAGAIIQRDTAGVNQAIESGADADAVINGTRPLHIATIAGSRAMVELLLHYGASPDGPDKLGRTPLHYAALGTPDSFHGLLEPLIDAGADVNAADSFGCTPLDLAAGAENRAAAAVLRTAGATCKPERQGWVQQVSGDTNGPSGRGRSL